MRRVPASLFALSLVLPLAAQAEGVPLTLTTSGYLLDTGDHPVTEQGVALGFSIWTDVSSPADLSHVWPATGESACVVGVVNGFYSTVLDGNQSTGCGAGLSSDHLPGTVPRYLQVSVGGVMLSPRMRIGTTPTAALATQSADTQALMLALASGGASVNDAGNVVDWKALKGVPGSIADGVDADTTYAAATNGGLSLLGQAFSIANNGVTNAMLAQSSVTVTAGTGLTGGGAVALGGTTTVALADVPGVTGSYTHPSITVDAQGRVTAAASGTVTSGTVTSVGAGAGLSGGPITASGSLAIANDGVTNAMLASDAASLAKVSGGSMALSAGNVGIGTTSPDAALTIKANNTFLKNYDTAGNARFSLSRSGNGIVYQGLSAPAGGDLVAIHSFSTYDTLNTSLQDRLTILKNGNVGIGTTSPTTTLQVTGGIRAGANGRIEYGWYQNSEQKTANYLHIKTGLWSGGSPTGNTEYIMGGFHATGYNYDGTSIDSYWMFHNWSGSLHALVVRNQGTYPYAKTAYVSTDGYVVIVADYTAASYIGATFDLIQSFGGYPWRTFGITATAQSNSTTGVF